MRQKIIQDVQLGCIF